MCEIFWKRCNFKIKFPAIKFKLDSPLTALIRTNIFQRHSVIFNRLNRAFSTEMFFFLASGPIQYSLLSLPLFQHYFTFLPLIALNCTFFLLSFPFVSSYFFPSFNLRYFHLSFQALIVSPLVYHRHPFFVSLFYTLIIFRNIYPPNSVCITDTARTQNQIKTL
jgi:hypothetical protein